jgi:hypothetical protein
MNYFLQKLISFLFKMFLSLLQVESWKGIQWSRDEWEIRREMMMETLYRQPPIWRSCLPHRADGNH